MTDWNICPLAMRAGHHPRRRSSHLARITSADGTAIDDTAGSDRRPAALVRHIGAAVVLAAAAAWALTFLALASSPLTRRHAGGGPGDIISRCDIVGGSGPCPEADQGHARW
jgi:hypothetical protein